MTVHWRERICCTLKRRQSPTIHEVLYYFSLAAGENLAPAYRELGGKPPAAAGHFA